MSHFQVIIFSGILFILILLAGFFSIAETSLMAVNRYRLRHRARLKSKYAINLLKLLKRPDRLLGAILIGSTFTNILASSLATLIAFHFWGDKGALLAAIVLTFVVLIFAEITPKTLAAIYPNQVAGVIQLPVRYFLKIMYPIVWFANTISNGLLRILRVKIPPDAIEPLSREELRSIVYETSGKISQQYQSMLLNILDLAKLTVDDVMVPRHEIVGIDINSPLETIIQELKQIALDFIPVYENDVNQMLGLLHVRNILQPLLMDQTFDKKMIQHYLQEPYFVPEGTALNVQLMHFQQSQDKVAFVVDEYGEILGVLTLTDILEEIVGDITHAHAHPAKHIDMQEDGSYIVDGSVTVREFNRVSEWNLPIAGPRTVNGLIVEYLQALPQTSSCVLIKDHPIEILLVKQNHVKLARIFPKI